MNKPKHTPGPWFVERIDSMRHMEIAKDTPVVSSGKYPSVFSHVVCLGGDKTAIANARLIAAAPDLLAQLKVAQKWIEFAKEHCALGTKAGGDWYIDQENIKAAIAKAEGEK